MARLNTLSEPRTAEGTGSYPSSSSPTWQLQNQGSVGHLCRRHAHTFIKISTRHSYSLLSTSHAYLHIGALSHTRALTHPCLWQLAERYGHRS